MPTWPRRTTFIEGDGSACDDMHERVWDVVCAAFTKTSVADMPRYARTLKKVDTCCSVF